MGDPPSKNAPPGPSNNEANTTSETTRQRATVATPGQRPRNLIQQAFDAMYEGFIRGHVTWNWYFGGNHIHYYGAPRTGSTPRRQRTGNRASTTTVTQGRSSHRSGQSHSRRRSNSYGSYGNVTDLGDIPAGVVISGMYENEVHIGNVESGADISGMFMDVVKIDNVERGATISGMFMSVVYIRNVESGASISGMFMSGMRVTNAAS